MVSIVWKRKPFKPKNEMKITVGLLTCSYLEIEKKDKYSWYKEANSNIILFVSV